MQAKWKGWPSSKTPMATGSRSWTQWTWRAYRNNTRFLLYIPGEHIYTVRSPKLCLWFNRGNPSPLFFGGDDHVVNDIHCSGCIRITQIVCVRNETKITTNWRKSLAAVWSHPVPLHGYSLLWVVDCDRISFSVALFVPEKAVLEKRRGRKKELKNIIFFSCFFFLAGGGGGGGGTNGIITWYNVVPSSQITLRNCFVYYTLRNCLVYIYIFLSLFIKHYLNATVFCLFLFF